MNKIIKFPGDKSVENEAQQPENGQEQYRADMQEFAREASRELIPVVRRISDLYDKAQASGALAANDSKRQFIERTMYILLKPMLDDMGKKGLL